MTVEKEVSSVLTDSKVFLQFTLASVIEAIRRNPDKYNNLLAINTSSSSTSAQDLLSHIEEYRDMILDESKTVYDRLLKHFINSIMDNTDGPLSSSGRTLSSTFPSLSNQRDIHSIEDPERFRNSKGED
jgi:hypothetical protein